MCEPAGEWDRLKRAFTAVLDLPADQRRSRLADLCGTDEQLRRAVEELLNAHDASPEFLAQPALRGAAGLIVRLAVPAVSAQTFTIGSVVGHLEILAFLGAGGAGEVYRAYDRMLERTVALKVLVDATDGPRSRELVVQEARAASALNHPHICTIYDVTEVGDHPCLLLEDVDGPTLHEYREGRRLSWRDAVRIAAQIADALAHAHSRGIVHRDLKPANVVIRSDGRVKVLDFGIAKRLAPGAGAVWDRPQGDQADRRISGTLPYLSPEVLGGAPADARSDVWSFGVLLYELLAGHRPFGGSTAQLAERIASEQPPRLPRAVPSSLARIVRRCLDKDPARRFANGTELHAALALLVSPSRRSRWLELAAGAALVLLVVGWIFVQLPRQIDAVTVGVLPFRAGETEGEMDPLQISIADSVVGRLSDVARLRLRPASATRKYITRERNPQQIARELQVDYLLTGEIHRSDGELRITARLLRGEDGNLVWTEEFRARAGDLLNVQDDIARRITQSLRIRLSAADRSRLDRRHTENAQAQRLYHRGRAYLIGGSEADLAAAINLFREAIALDPSYVLAHAGLGVAAASMTLFHAQEPAVERWKAEALQASRQAVHLGDDVAEAHEALAAVYRFLEFGWDETIQASRRALELKPNLDLPHVYMASAFSHLGLLDEVSITTSAAMELNPVNVTEPLRVQGATAVFAGRYSEAVTLLEQSAQTGGQVPAEWNLAYAYYYAGRHDEAVQMLQRLVQQPKNARSLRRAQATLASILAKEGDRMAALDLISTVQSASYTDHHVQYSIGAALAQLGDVPAAVERLREARDTGFPCYPWFNRDPLLEPARSDPAFQQLLGQTRAAWEAASRKYPSSAAGR